MTHPAEADPDVRARRIRAEHAEHLRSFGAQDPETDAALLAACLDTTADEIHRALGRTDTESPDAVQV